MIDRFGIARLRYLKLEKWLVNPEPKILRKLFRFISRILVNCKMIVSSDTVILAFVDFPSESKIHKFFINWHWLTCNKNAVGKASKNLEKTNFEPAIADKAGVTKRRHKPQKIKGVRSRPKAITGPLSKSCCYKNEKWASVQNYLRTSWKF